MTMFTKNAAKPSHHKLSGSIARLKKELEQADAVLIGAGAGLSAAAGLTYSGERFEKHFADFHAKYGIADMYSGGFYPYATQEEYWAWWSRQILINRYESGPAPLYQSLLKLVHGKDYFVLTTNVDHQFQLNGFDKKRLFYTQGDYGLWQCSKACHAQTYDNEEAVRQMMAAQKDMRIPSEMIPHCPRCGAPMTMNLRCDNSFVQDEGWYAAHTRYDDYVRRHKDLRILYLELGVGVNTPGIIKVPFWQMTYEGKNATYASICMDAAFCPDEIRGKSICIRAELALILKSLVT